MIRKLTLLFISLVIAATGRISAQTATAEELTLPAIPSDLRQPAERAGYLVNHFWDNLDFASDKRVGQQGFLEQSFANFLSVMPIADVKDQVSAVACLMDKVAVNKDAYKVMAGLAEKYLYELESPFASDSIYEMFLDKMLSQRVFDDIYKVRLNAQKEAVTRNREGLIAADFSYTTQTSPKNTLYGTAIPGKYLVMIFYDPDCDHCREVMRTLASNSGVRSRIDSGDIAVLAVYSGDDKELWEERIAELPSEWIIGYEDGTMQDEGVYILRQMPTIYILDQNKRVLRKEVRPDELIVVLTELE